MRWSWARRSLGLRPTANGRAARVAAEQLEVLRDEDVALGVRRDHVDDIAAVGELHHPLERARVLGGGRGGGLGGGVAGHVGAEARGGAWPCGNALRRGGGV